MVEFNERTQANMDVVLEDVGAELPNGGDHESRKFIAEQLIQCARSGRTTLRQDSPDCSINRPESAIFARNHARKI